ncbi:hypothetical protein FF38_08908 [Lucilia cuprina]|uniref:C2H2-type domain-containing protein n=1 Tax=Lucilia cuprina TaxID=7375 RepID=A0A0L0BWX9_LUCCU|nr:hypothetical protein FF38_08908 [Lucilia cuprina]
MASQPDRRTDSHVLIDSKCDSESIGILKVSSLEDLGNLNSIKLTYVCVFDCSAVMFCTLLIPYHMRAH